MNASKKIRFEELADSIVKSANLIPDDNPYKDLANIMKRQITNHQKAVADNNISLRILSDLDSGKIELRVLNIITKGLQSSFSSACNHLFGNHKDIGAIPRHILNSSSLVLTETRAGSFIVDLETKEKSEKRQFTLDGESSDKSYILSEIIAIVDEEDKIAEKIIEEFGVRTFKTSRDWFKKMDNENVSFEYKDMFLNEKKIFEPIKIKKIAKELSDIKVDFKEDNIELVGKLKSVSDPKNTLLFETNEKDYLEVKILDNSLEDNELTTNKTYTLNVNKLALEDSTGKIETKYTLNSVNNTDLVNTDIQNK